MRRGFSDARGACGVRLTAPRRCRTPPARLRRPTGPGIFSTETVNSGLPIHFAAKLLGHLDLKTTKG